MSTCGHANVKGARFCATCGAALTAATATKAAPDEGLTVVLPGLDRSPEPAPPKTKPRERKQRKRGLLIATIIGLVVALAASTFAVVAVIKRDDASAEVYLEAAKRPGANPFTKNVANQNPTLTNSYDAKGKTGTGVVLTVAGTEPGLYGGTQNNQSCDPQKLVKFLASEPAKAAAWAGVLGITPTQISKYVAGLTPAILRADTRVSNHGFANGTATVLQSVLQAGTAVLVDNHGIPRVRCSCGNPLTEPEPVQATYTGTPWPSFDEHHVVAITNGPPTDTFTLTDPTTGSTYTQPTGTSTDTGVFALGTDNGLQLLKDGKVISTALLGRHVSDFAESPDHTRLAFFSRPAANGTDESGPPTTLSILERDGTITTINSNLGWRVGSLTWTDATHLAYANDASTGASSPPAIVATDSASQPDRLTALGSYGGFDSAPGARFGLGVDWRTGTAPHWIDFATRTDSVAPNIDFADCGNGPSHSCGTSEFSPNGSKVLAVSRQGVHIADPGGAFVTAIEGVDLQAFWLDDHRIVYTTIDYATAGRVNSEVHIFDLRSHETQDRGVGTALGLIGRNVLIAVGRSGDPQTLAIFDPATSERRTGSGYAFPGPAFLAGGTVEASYGTSGIGFATGDTGALDYPYLVDTARSTVLGLSSSQYTFISDAARSPALMISRVTR